jgi:hypothetical protein
MEITHSHQVGEGTFECADFTCDVYRIQRAERRADLARYRRATAERDWLIVTAWQLGMSKAEISRLSGLSRPSVFRVIARVRADLPVPVQGRSPGQ